MASGVRDMGPRGCWAQPDSLELGQGSVAQSLGVLTSVQEAVKPAGENVSLSGGEWHL